MRAARSRQVHSGRGETKPQGKGKKVIGSVDAFGSRYWTLGSNLWPDVLGLDNQEKASGFFNKFL